MIQTHLDKNNSLGSLKSLMEDKAINLFLNKKASMENLKYQIKVWKRTKMS